MSLSITLGSHWHEEQLGTRAHIECKSGRVLDLYSAKFSQAPGPDDDVIPTPSPQEAFS